MGLEIHDFTEESDNNSVSDIPNMSTGTDYERSSFEDHELGSIIGDSNEDESIDAKIDNKPLLGNMSKMAVNVLYTPENQCDFPSTQNVYLEEEDLNIILTGYRFHRFRTYIYYIFCFLTGGSLFLLARWIPKIWIWWVGIVCVMGKAEFITIKNQWGEIAIEFVNRKYYGGTISSVFSVDQLDEEDMARNNSDPDEILHNLRYFDHRYIRFIYHPGIGKFLQNGYWKDSSWTSTKVLKKGITRAVHDERKIIFGPNIIDVQEKSALRLLTDEVLHPFYIFQVFSMILWFLDEYYYYAACILIISATSVITTLIETKQTMHRLREMSKFVCDVRIFRNGLWRYSSSEVLVPGDVFEISDPGLYVYPCDAILLTGDCIVNESMLTGESVPVSKLPITDASLRMMDLTAVNVRPEIAKHFLFCGTKIVRVRKTKSNIDGIEDEGSALAMVVRTGFNTTKGSLIRSMLFPKPNKFKFYRDAFRFIGILSLIAGIGFFISTINFIRMGVNIHLIIVRALDLITIVVPPALPTTMSIGTSFSLARLRKAQIFCISPARVNIGGKLNVMCFDKTGTLTEDCLDVLGIRCTDHIKNKFSDLHTSIETLSNLNLNDLSESDFTSILYAMATCHSLKLVDGKLIGDPLDLKMFEFTKWLLEESVQNTSCPPNFTRISNESSTSSFRPATPNSMVGSGSIVPTVVRPPGSRKFELSDLLDNDGKDGERKNTPFLELGIIRTFEFVSSLRRMSVLVKRLRSPTIEVYVKGAPEVMREICKPDSIPEDYDELLNYYTHHGFRVIACASRSFDNLNWMKAQKIKREQVEQDLQFLGIIIFENKLKSGTSPVIEKLKRAKIRQIMCTGDNVLTAISVSRECGLINKNTKAYVPRFIQGSSITPRAEIAWESLDDPKDVLDSKTLKPLIQPPSNFSNEYPMINSCDYDLAVTGDIFRWMIDFADEVTLFKMFVKGQIFARMSPDEKHELVEKLQLMGYCVGFCGDGANDCGALKAADVGLSLSEAEASVAAPFTSHTMDIGCVIEVIKEGRAALVTSFSCFKYMALYSIIQFTTVSLLYSFASNLGNFQFLYIDLFLILPVAVLMGRTEPYPLINPKRPTASLVSRRVLTSLIGQILIQSGFQIFVYLLIREQPWYKPPVIDPDDTNIVCFENTILFILSCFQYLLIAAVFSVGPPYRKPMHSNVPFVFSTIFLTLITTIILLYPAGFVRQILELKVIEYNFRWYLLFIAVLDFIVSWLMEKYVFDVLAQWIGNLMGGKVKVHKKLYKKIQNEWDRT